MLFLLRASTFGLLKNLAFSIPKNHSIYFNMPLNNILYISYSIILPFNLNIIFYAYRRDRKLNIKQTFIFIFYV